MTKEQLKQAIEQITHAIALINTCEGYDYLKAHHTTQLMIDERQKLEKQLDETYIIKLNDKEIDKVVGRYKAVKHLTKLKREHAEIGFTMEKW